MTPTPSEHRDALALFTPFGVEIGNGKPIKRHVSDVCHPCSRNLLPTTLCATCSLASARLQPWLAEHTGPRDPEVDGLAGRSGVPAPWVPRVNRPRAR